MSRGARWLLTILVGGTLLFAATVGLAAAAVYRAGTIGVDVRDSGGGQVSVSVPAGLAQIAIALVPTSIVREALDEAEPWVPAARTAWDQLEGAGDFVLFEYRGEGDTVRVERQDRLLRVTGEADGVSFRVSLPVAVVSSVLKRLG